MSENCTCRAIKVGGRYTGSFNIDEACRWAYARSLSCEKCRDGRPTDDWSQWKHAARGWGAAEPMNRDQMIEVAKHALCEQQNPIDEWDDAEPAERVVAHHDAAAVVGALIAAGCVPSDDLAHEQHIDAYSLHALGSPRDGNLLRRFTEDAPPVTAVASGLPYWNGYVWYSEWHTDGECERFALKLGAAVTPDERNEP